MPSTKKSISIRQLFQEIPVQILSPVPEISVSGIASDSRLVKPGNLFVAVPGELADGHSFIKSAIEQGAAAVVGTHPLQAVGVPYIRVSNSRQALPYLAAGVFGYPARNLAVLGVTGTDGKTTTANIIYHILKAGDLPVGMISTVNALIGDLALDTGFHVTTPEPLDIQRYLARMVSAGMSHVIVEATSHGLAQHRVDGCDFDIGVLTNITHEHLDYHGSYEDYRAAKARLFTDLASTNPKSFAPPRGAVLNRDDTSYEYLANLTSLPVVSYGFHPEADLRPANVTEGPKGLSFMVVGPGFHFPVKTVLEGQFNISNCLAAIAATTILMGLNPEQVQAGIARIPGVPGRMERLEIGQDFTAIVDFAHTPNALRSALRAARRIAGASETPGRVIAVFGSAGLRDRAKRRMMAEASAELADMTVLTAEDPRTETLENILADMAAGAQARGADEGKNFWRIPDRGEAIRYAVSLAQPGDVVMACGKGHEQSMCFGTVEYAWDDKTAMLAALCERLNIPGPAMPYLPTREDRLAS